MENSTLGHDGLVRRQVRVHRFLCVDGAVLQDPAHAAVGARLADTCAFGSSRVVRFSGSDSGASMMMRVCITGTGRPMYSRYTAPAAKNGFSSRTRDLFFDHRADLDRGQRAFRDVAVVVHLVVGAASRGVAQQVLVEQVFAAVGA